MIGIGKLVDVDYFRNGDRYRMKFPLSTWLVWDEDSQNFLIARRVDAKPGKINATEIKLHKHFHGYAPDSAAVFEWKRPGRHLEIYGTAASVHYSVPTRMDSTKIRDESGKLISYRHEFGEVTPGVPVDNDQLRPLFVVDNKTGQIHFQRRPYNTYRLSDWIEG